MCVREDDGVCVREDDGVPVRDDEGVLVGELVGVLDGVLDTLHPTPTSRMTPSARKHTLFTSDTFVGSPIHPGVPYTEMSARHSGVAAPLELHDQPMSDAGVPTAVRTATQRDAPVPLSGTATTVAFDSWCASHVVVSLNVSTLKAVELPEANSEIPRRFASRAGTAAAPPCSQKASVSITTKNKLGREEMRFAIARIRFRMT